MKVASHYEQLNRIKIVMKIKQPMNQLAPICENEDLKKGSKYVVELGLLLQKAETSTKLTPPVTTIKKQYIVARRNINKHIQMEKLLTVQSKC